MDRMTKIAAAIAAGVWVLHGTVEGIKIVLSGKFKRIRCWFRRCKL